MTSSAGWIVQRYGIVASTMDIAAWLARCGARERTAVVADEQTAGRGRGGREWRSPAGSGLYCTAILRPDVPPPRLTTLPLLAGVAVAETIEALTGYPPRLKWPNDVWLGSHSDRQKVAGVLATSSLMGDRVEYVLLGVGVNVTTGVEDLPTGATSIAAATGVHLAPADVLATLLGRLDDAYAMFRRTGGKPSLDRWRARAVFLGQQVAVAESGRILVGLFIGVDDDGALLLRQAEGTIRRVVAGDLVRGPSPLS